jgi:ligand-binding sensor domain-containing protein/signal transduction histidine kinase
MWQLPWPWSRWVGRYRALAFGLAAAPLALFAGNGSSTLADKPVVGKNADGHIEVFKVDPAGELFHRWQKVSDGSWSRWVSLGRGIQPGVALSSNADGAVEIFAARTNGAVVLSQQSAPNGFEWTPWTNLSGHMRAPIAVGPELDGRLEIFGVGANGAMQHCWQTSPNDHWSGWTSLGGSNFDPGVNLVCNQDGRLEIFALEAGARSLWHCWEAKPNASQTWAAWENLGGSIQPGFVVNKNVIGRVEVFGISSAGDRARRIFQAWPGQSDAWSDWEDFSRNFNPDSNRVYQLARKLLQPGDVGDRLISGLATGHSADGRIEVFAVSRNGHTLLHRWENFADDSDRWSDWDTLGAQAQPYPAAVENDDGNIEVFATDFTNNDIINHRSQISHASDWLDWSSLDQPVFRYNSRTWQTDEGLPDNVVQAIAQTRDGFLWIGTRRGLARFDGVSFTVFNLKDVPELENASITALCADRTGPLWVGTEGRGLFCLSAGKFYHFGKTDGLAGDTIGAIYEAGNGALWIGTSTGLSKFGGGKFVNYTKKEGLLSDVVRNIYEDREQNLWVATGAGLNRIHDGIKSFAMPNGLPNDSVRAICQDRGGRVWIGSNNGMLWYDWYWANHFFAYNSRYGISDTFVSAICQDPDGNLWVGTYSGLNRFREGRFYVERDREGLPFAKVNALFADGEGNVWVGSNEGLVRLTPMRFTTYTKQQGLTHNNVMSVLEDHSGKIWAGTWGGGLDCLQEENIQPYSMTTNFSENLVLSLGQGRDGSLWVGADYDGGLTRIKNGALKHYGAKSGLISAGIHALLEDTNGNLWIGTAHGLNCLRKGKFTAYTRTNNLAGNDVRAIAEDREGRIWFGTDGGVSCWQGGELLTPPGLASLADQTVTAMREDSDGDLWFGTQAGGLSRYRGGELRTYTTAQGLADNEVLEILQDNSGCFWMSCSKGIFRARKADFDAYDSGNITSVPCAFYGKDDGMESGQCNGQGKPAGWKDREGHLWFPTTKGLVTLDPNIVKWNLTPPPVYIEELLADKKSVLPPKEAKEEGPLKIAPGQGELDFHFTALELQSPEQVRFKYQLAGVDPDWVDAGTRRDAHYIVSQGKYVFRVTACNKDGVWNKDGASLAFVVLPHIWETWWFRAAVILLVVGTASGSARYLEMRRLRRRMEIMEQRAAIERERGRIAKDIHDDLGSSLTRIMMLGERTEEGLVKNEEVAPHVRKIVSSARETVKSLDEIVWAVNPENDTLDGLVTYISHYADEFFENTEVSCRLELPLKLPAVTLPAEVRHDLFLVVKEAFNNCLKHSGASVVRVCVSGQSDSTTISVTDNGCGLPANVEDNGHNGGRVGHGLLNMRKRIESLGGNFSVKSQPEQGTEISFSVKLNTGLGEIKK